MPAVDAIAEHLNDGIELVDYGARRDALAGWCLTTPEWDQLIGDLRRKTEHRASRWPGTLWIDWHDSKRVLASMWIWVHLTGGEHIFAPAIRPHPGQPRRGGRELAQIHSRWRLISAESPTGHHAVLRARLVPYAEQILRAIHSDSFNTSSIPQHKVAP
jgi:hypothetical protein